MLAGSSKQGPLHRRDYCSAGPRPVPHARRAGLPGWRAEGAAVAWFLPPPGRALAGGGGLKWETSSLPCGRGSALCPAGRSPLEDGTPPSAARGSGVCPAGSRGGRSVPPPPPFSSLHEPQMCFTERAGVTGILARARPRVWVVAVCHSALLEVICIILWGDG